MGTTHVVYRMEWVYGVSRCLFRLWKIAWLGRFQPDGSDGYQHSRSRFTIMAVIYNIQYVSISVCNYIYIYMYTHYIHIYKSTRNTHIYIYIQYLQNIVFSLSSAGHSIWNSSSSGRFELCFFGHSIPLGTVSRSWRASPTACFMGKWTHLAVSMVIGVPPQSSILDWAYFPLWTYKPTIWGYTGYLHFRTPPSRWWRSWWASPHAMGVS